VGRARGCEEGRKQERGDGPPCMVDHLVFTINSFGERLFFCKRPANMPHISYYNNCESREGDITMLVHWPGR
jgi:hypothetical protein